MISDEGSNAGDKTLFPNTINGIADFSDRIAQMDYASNGNSNFKVIVRNVLQYTQTGSQGEWHAIHYCSYPIPRKTCPI